VGNCMYALLPVATMLAIGHLTGRKPARALTTTLALAGCAGATLVWLADAPRYFASAPIGIGFATAMLWCTAAVAMTREQRSSVYRFSLLTTLAVVAAVCVVRVLAAFSGFHDLLVPMSGSAMQTATALAAILLVTAGSMSVLGLLEEMRHQRVTEEGQRDGLTGVLLRNPFLAMSSEVLDRVAEPFTVVMLDIDNFKSINDTFGHATGDAVIADCAGVLKQRVRAGDLVGRLGGEEFALTLPRCEVSQALEVAERIRTQIEGGTITGKKGPISYTVSIGLAQGTPRVNARATLEHALHLADEALYLAKRSGKNQTVISSSETHPPHRDIALERG
jgi:diguanylate cyclase (GGDEF)-like protein